MDGATIATVIVGALTAFGGILTFWINFSSKVTEAKGTADAASKKASESVARSIELEKEVTALRVKVAEDYVSKDMLGALEKRVIDAINALGSRIDGLIKAQH